MAGLQSVWNFFGIFIVIFIIGAIITYPSLLLSNYLYTKSINENNPNANLSMDLNPVQGTGLLSLGLPTLMICFLFSIYITYRIMSGNKSATIEYTAVSST